MKHRVTLTTTVVTTRTCTPCRRKSSQAHDQPDHSYGVAPRAASNHAPATVLLCGVSRASLPAASHLSTHHRPSADVPPPPWLQRAAAVAVAAGLQKPRGLATTWHVPSAARPSTTHTITLTRARSPPTVLRPYQLPARARAPLRVAAACGRCLTVWLELSLVSVRYEDLFQCWQVYMYMIVLYVTCSTGKWRS